MGNKGNAVLRYAQDKHLTLSDWITVRDGAEEQIKAVSPEDAISIQLAQPEDNLRKTKELGKQAARRYQEIALQLNDPIFDEVEANARWLIAEIYTIDKLAPYIDKIPSKVWEIYNSQLMMALSHLNSTLARAGLPQISEFAPDLWIDARDHHAAIDKAIRPKGDPDGDSGAMLQKIAEEADPNFVLVRTTYLSERISSGRKPGPDPVTKYILNKALEIREERHFTWGETYNFLMDELRRLESVRNWLIAIEEHESQPASRRDMNRDPRNKLDKESIEVQAYEQAKGQRKRTQEEGGKYLSDMWQNEKDRERGRNISTAKRASD